MNASQKSCNIYIGRMFGMISRVNMLGFISSQGYSMYKIFPSSLWLVLINKLANNDLIDWTSVETVFLSIHKTPIHK